MGILQYESAIFINQRKYAVSLLQNFGLKNCKPISTSLMVSDKLKKDDESEKTDDNVYKKLVGSLLYMIATRPDIMFAVSLLARFMHGPTKKHLGAAKGVLKYIQGILDYRIEYEKGKKSILIGYYNSDWSEDETDMKSTSGYAFSFGGGVFSRASVKQHSVALSTAEAEYISTTEATTQAV
ncbi:secreted RxLR effector protein 161-like [Pyrus communis]|uniref:secreted RxLR effector protein 161-like n=1 Tax=Pyrus communis TaxID=23211 RepID=UPI0035C1B90B